MIEILLVLAVLGSLGGGAALMQWASATQLLVAGAALLLAGLGFGVPAGLLYHVALHRALWSQGRLPPGWWLRPTRLHDELAAEDRFRVLAWCWIGAAGFLVTMLGCVVATLGAARLLQG